MSIIFLYCYVVCIWLQIKKSVYFIIQLIFVIIYDSIALFGVIHGSHCTISANFYLYLLYFQQKNFNFNFSTHTRTQSMLPTSLSQGSFPSIPRIIPRIFSSFMWKKIMCSCQPKPFLFSLLSCFLPLLCHIHLYLWVIQLKIKI